ncbi:peptidoglycan/LPS O-acetylase OafA/YrhL [Paraburkholderia unamae]|uniref:acyltransferase family protein n=1 Tax=Paraburkholderia unamae TaxID=219649 RepID=UPI000DC367F3|nr:acyltransferase family protein [Paraburkholderia unamae]RAR51900.1 peptidoglycan/LPS O-acetylase OafA/YrhL [Paraburkholderia unamae]
MQVSLRSSHEFEYRPDIDGLRAISVLAVLIYHLDKNILPGGFIGVDIFFVISGYLITHQILTRIEDRDFKLTMFYRHRILRLLPALFSMLIVTCAVGLFLLSPADLVKLAKSAALAMFGLSNIYLWHEYGGYFNGGASEAPLLHTWSLAVEEQFYLIWPFVLFALTKRSGRSRIVFCIILLLVATAISEFGVRYAQSAAYFLLPTRIFEPLAGAALAIFLTSFNHHRCSAIFKNSLGFAGLTLITASMVIIDDTAPFPGLVAAIPVAAAAFLIFSGLNLKSHLTKFLSCSPLKFIGLISYSVYLWHWPIIAFVSYYGIESTIAVNLTILMCSLLIGYISWKYIEKPFRNADKQLSFPRFIIQRYVPTTALVLGFSIICVLSSGLPARWSDRTLAYDRAESQRPDQIRAGCHVSTQNYAALPQTRCVIGKPAGDVQGILIGDSYANHFTSMIDALASQDHITLRDYTMDGCPPILGYSNQRKASYAAKCIARNDFQYSLIERSRFRLVILAAHWPANDPDGKLGQAVNASVRAIVTTNAHLTIVLPNQTIAHAAECPLRVVMYGKQRDCTVPRRPSMPDYLAKVKAAYPQVTFLDPDSVICTANTCSPVYNDVPLYRDDGHLNDAGSRMLGDELSRRGVGLTGQRSSS